MEENYIIFLKYLIPVALGFILYLFLKNNRKRKLRKIKVIEKEDLKFRFSGLSIDLLYTFYFRDIAYLSQMGKCNILLISQDKADMELISYHYLNDHYDKILFFDLGACKDDSWFFKILRRISFLIGITDTDVFNHLLKLLAQHFKLDITETDNFDLIKSTIVECRKKNVGICFQNINETNLLADSLFSLFIEKADFLILTSQNQKLLNTLSRNLFSHVITKDYISTIPLIYSYLKNSKTHYGRSQIFKLDNEDYESLLESVFKNGGNFDIFNLWLYSSTGIDSILNLLDEAHIPKDSKVFREWIENESSKIFKKRLNKLKSKHKLLLYALSYFPITVSKEKVSEYCINYGIDLSSITSLQRLNLISSSNRYSYSNILIEFFLVRHFYPELLNILFFNDTETVFEETRTVLKLNQTNNFLLLSLIQHSFCNPIYDNTNSFYIHPWLHNVLVNEKEFEKYEQKAKKFIRTKGNSKNKLLYEEVVNLLFELAEIEDDSIIRDNLTFNFSDDTEECILDYYSYYLRMFFKLRVNKAVMNQGFISSALAIIPVLGITPELVIDKQSPLLIEIV